MGIGSRLIACPSCACHAFVHETVCPTCGTPLRTADGSIQRTAGAVMLGLTLATASVSSCGDDTTTSSGSNNGGMGGVDMSGSTAISAYGIASTSSGQSGPGGMGGMGGTGGIGGSGGSGGAGGSGGM